MTKIVTLNNKKKHCNCSKKHTKKAGPLDTLAQLGTNGQNEDKLSLVQSTTLEDTEKLKKRAKRKYFSNALTLGLVDASKANTKSILTKSYWRSFHCNATLSIFDDGTISGHYCNNRWCMTCNAIRTAKNINNYAPILASWHQPYFVTLTVPNVQAEDLKTCIEGMQRNFVKAKDRLKKQARRNGLPNFVGLRKLECTYNSTLDNYHPHYHFVVKDKVNAQKLNDYWLEYYPSANQRAQDVRQADKNVGIELFKYFTKVITDTKEGRVIFADSLDIIFNAIRGKRTFQAFGFKLPKLDEETNVIQHNLVHDRATWIQELADWVTINYETGEVTGVSGNSPDSRLENFVTKKVVIRNR